MSTTGEKLGDGILEWADKPEGSALILPVSTKSGHLVTLKVSIDRRVSWEQVNAEHLADTIKWLWGDA